MYLDWNDYLLKVLDKFDNKPSAIFCSDVHWRETSPVCRTDNYVDALECKMMFIKKLCESVGAPLYIAGDFFHKATPPLGLVWRAYHCLPDTHTFIIPGQHDLVGHNIETFSRTGLGILSFSDKITVIKNPFERGYETSINGKTVVLLHRFVYNMNAPWEGCGGSECRQVFREFPNADLIVIGDNHDPFMMIVRNERILVNCGSIMRSTAKQKNHIPTVYAWWSESNEIREIPLPFKKDVISDKHLEKAVDKEHRIESFLAGMDVCTEDLDMDFKNIAKKIISNSKTNEKTEQRFWEIIDYAEKGKQV